MPVSAKFARRIIRFAGGCLLVALVAGCISRPKDISPRVRVTIAPAPAPSGAAVLPVLVETDPRFPWTIPEPGRLTDPSLITYAAAREAYWNADTDTAIKLLRELRAADGISEPHFWWVLIQCYEESRRWSESLELYAEFGIEEKRRAWMDDARFRASLPRQELEVAAGAPGLTMNREFGDIVIVDGTINGAKARLLLDTGATGTWLSEKFARQAGVQFLGHTSSMGDSNQVSRAGSTALVGELKMGGLTARNVLATVGHSYLMERAMKVDGIVGWDILREVDITWDFPGNVVSFAAPQGPVSAEPNLSGRIKPILEFTSPEGRRLHLFFDTGFFNNHGSFALFTNEGVLETKTHVRQFRRPWLPSVSWGMNSFAFYWPRRAPFELWMGGYRFEFPAAYLHKRTKRAEELVFEDGVIGNGAFLRGVLKMSGTRRDVQFELSPMRNPFGVLDVLDPDGASVGAFAATVRFLDETKDANAASWSEQTVSGTRDSIDGEWSSRWNVRKPAKSWVSGAAQVKSVGDRVYILYQDKRDGAYLLDLRRVGTDRLVGRYVNLRQPNDSTPWVGRIVDPERIDGHWAGGRWDLRRKLRP